MMLRKIIYSILYLLAIAGLVTLFGFAARYQNNTPCSNAEITITSLSGNYFLHHDDIKDAINEHLDSLEGTIMTAERLMNLHGLISSNPFVANANVFRTVQGKIGIEITLRDPVVRVVNIDNQSFYIDSEGYMFPLSERHTARVMIATGRIAAPFVAGAHVNDTSAEGQVDAHLSELFQLVSFIHSESFWRAFIDHVYVTAEGKYELTPRNAVHIIQFGKADRIAQKFRKLKMFYTGNLAQKGWYYYKTINLEFNNQVICSK